MISYKPFQKLLIDRGLKKNQMTEMAGISGATMAKLNTTEYVSLEIIDRLCAALDCQPGDLLTYVSDEMEGNNDAKTV
jgi:DNA-binding Xre family transcriptional regulator